MILRLPYGRGAIAADLRGLRCQTLAPSSPRAHEVRGTATAALDDPVASPRLEELARRRRRVTVLVPDATRKAALPDVLPLILDRLASGGVPADAVTVLVACGTHPPAPAGPLAALLGELPAGVRVVQHDAREADGLVPVGMLSSGSTVRLNRLAVEADLLVAVSTVGHHYFAGFGGGPKLVFPGVAGYEETQANHSRVIDLAAQPPRRHPGCEPGQLAGNPVAEEIMAAARLRLPDFCLYLVAGGDGRPAWATAGGFEAGYVAACERVRQWFEVPGGPFEMVVVSAGGAPSDSTLIQAHKALDAGCRFAAPGGEVLFIASCEQGAGSPEMEPFLADPRPEAIIARLAQRYVQYGHTTLRLVEKTSRYRVSIASSLPDELAYRLGMTPVRDAQDVLDRWRDEATGSVVGVMTGPVVYPALR